MLKKRKNCILSLSALILCFTLLFTGCDSKTSIIEDVDKELVSKVGDDNDDSNKSNGNDASSKSDGKDASSKSDGNGTSHEDTGSSLISRFFSDEVLAGNINVFFLDVDNISYGDEFERTYQSDSSTNVGSCDCYMIKVGNTEILVDCGYQTFNSDAYTREDYPYKFTYQYLKENVHDNLLRKITSICTDGVLEYLIVTHSDFDHIASLCVEGGLIDSFVNHETVNNLENVAVTLNGITNIIDFNSGVIALHSYSEIGSESRLCKGLYQTYLVKINDLIQSGTNYLPAAALFAENVAATDETTMTQENKLLATPDNMQKYVEDDNFSTMILTETQANDAATEYVDDVPKNASYSDNVTALNGQLMVENERYYYSIPLENDAELRILYNWYYDFARRQSFDGQSRNNPSVCFEVVKGSFKFLSCGDMGGNGENGLLKYYAGTTVLDNVTAFKASHHGSTTNGENSEALFAETTPKIIVVTDCAQSPLEVKNTTAAYMRQQFFDNIYNAFHDKESGELVNGLTEEPYILCTNIDWYRLNEQNNIAIHESKPMYGDIHISSTGSEIHLNYSYKGTIHAFVKTGNENDTVDFSTVNDNKKIIKLQNTKWFEKVGFIYDND